MFASDKFIEASRQFVCIRIETYENKEAERMVRELLNGRYANTSFCIFDPRGRRRLSRSGRSPSGLGQFRGRDDGEPNEDQIIQEMNRIAARYKPKGESAETLLQDFLTFRQALNVASADQRLLVMVDASSKEKKSVESELKSVFADSDIVGKFHVNMVDESKDKNWSKNIKGASERSGIYIIRAGTFGQDGTVLSKLPLSTKAEKIKSTLLAANGKFAKLEKRKTYGQHVMQGRRQGIYFENEIPYGEDRDGDGKIDKEQRRRK